MLFNTNLSNEAAILTKWLVSIPSVAHAKGPSLITKAIYDGLGEFPYFKNHADHLNLIAHEESSKSSIVALVKSFDAIEDTLVILCDTDTNSPYHYGVLKRFSTNCDELQKQLSQSKDITNETLKKGIDSGDLMFGLGILQSKCATGSMLVALKELSDNHVRLKLNILFICTSESAIQHRGIKKCIPFVHDLIKKEHLKLRLCVNAKPNFPISRTDKDLHIYTGNYGKVEPSFYIIGNSASAFRPYAGFSASIIASELIRELELNPLFSQSLHQKPLVPTFDSLRVKEFGKDYSPDGMQISFSMPLVNISLDDLLELLKNSAAKAIENAAELIDQREASYANLNHEEFIPLAQDAEVVSFSDLLERASHNFTGDLNKALQGMVLKCRSEGLSLHQAGITIIERLNELAKLPRPSVVVYFTDNYVPTQGLSASSSQDRELFMILDGLINKFSAVSPIVPTMATNYAPSDAGFSRPVNLKDSLNTLARECPVGISDIEGIDVPTITIGVKGDHLTLLTEHVDTSMCQYLPAFVLSLADAIANTPENSLENYQDDLQRHLDALEHRAEAIAGAAINAAQQAHEHRSGDNTFYSKLSQGTLEPESLDNFLKQQGSQSGSSMSGPMLSAPSAQANPSAASNVTQEQAKAEVDEQANGQAQAQSRDDTQSLSDAQSRAQAEARAAAQAEAEAQAKAEAAAVEAKAQAEAQARAAASAAAQANAAKAFFTSPAQSQAAEDTDSLSREHKINPYAETNAVAQEIAQRINAEQAYAASAQGSIEQSEDNYPNEYQDDEEDLDPPQYVEAQEVHDTDSVHASNAQNTAAQSDVSYVSAASDDEDGIISPQARTDFSKLSAQSVYTDAQVLSEVPGDGLSEPVVELTQVKVAATEEKHFGLFNNLGKIFKRKSADSKDESKVDTAPAIDTAATLDSEAALDTAAESQVNERDRTISAADADLAAANVSDQDDVEPAAELSSSNNAASEDVAYEQESDETAVATSAAVNADGDVDADADEQVQEQVSHAADDDAGNLDASVTAEAREARLERELDSIVQSDVLNADDDKTDAVIASMHTAAVGSEDKTITMQAEPPRKSIESILSSIEQQTQVQSKSDVATEARSDASASAATQDSKPSMSSVDEINDDNVASLIASSINRKIEQNNLVSIDSPKPYRQSANPLSDVIYADSVSVGEVRTTDNGAARKESAARTSAPNSADTNASNNGPLNFNGAAATAAVAHDLDKPANLSLDSAPKPFTLPDENAIAGAIAGNNSASAKRFLVVNSDPQNTRDPEEVYAEARAEAEAAKLAAAEKSRREGQRAIAMEAIRAAQAAQKAQMAESSDAQVKMAESSDAQDNSSDEVAQTVASAEDSSADLVTNAEQVPSDNTEALDAAPSQDVATEPDVESDKSGADAKPTASAAVAADTSVAPKASPSNVKAAAPSEAAKASKKLEPLDAATLREIAALKKVNSEEAIAELLYASDLDEKDASGIESDVKEQNAAQNSVAAGVEANSQPKDESSEQEIAVVPDTILSAKAIITTSKTETTNSVITDSRATKPFMDPVEAITTEVLDDKDAKSKSNDGVATVITSGAYAPASTDAEADNNAALVVEEQSHKDPTEEHSYTTEETDDYVATVITKTIIQKDESLSEGNAATNADINTDASADAADAADADAVAVSVAAKASDGAASDKQGTADTVDQGAQAQVGDGADEASNGTSAEEEAKIAAKAALDEKRAALRRAMYGDDADNMPPRRKRGSYIDLTGRGDVLSYDPDELTKSFEQPENSQSGANVVDGALSRNVPVSSLSSAEIRAMAQAKAEADRAAAEAANAGAEAIKAKSPGVRIMRTTTAPKAQPQAQQDQMVYSQGGAVVVSKRVSAEEAGALLNANKQSARIPTSPTAIEGSTSYLERTAEKSIMSQHERIKEDASVPTTIVVRGN
ncbi:MAG: hypothetical protein Q4A68_03140 [Anaerobiospirillum succiniciproducens]|uniref:hypothetical protein n=1 Tax=Anaerobiospirillum succiniciproducens TaxID=13335 RepID=UPI0026DC6BF8|nr:hypothetical protein [Anaerobiospirillum succiniciproducens]MDO4675562.1 hypothetical protein [Anaerobiospirillum succiniciproducens]